MKKLLFLLLVTAAFIGCSSDDNNSEVPVVVKQELVISTTKVNVIVGEELVFTVKDKAGKKVDAGIYVDNKKVTNPVKFDQAGKFSIVAKKEGFKDSAVITVNVKAKGKVNGYNVNGFEKEIELVILDVIQVDTIDVNGKAIVVDKVIELEDGRLANEYILMPLEQNNYTFLTLWVVNNSIVKKDGVIVDYGKRILPTEVSKKSDIVFAHFFVVGGEEFIMENFLTVDSFVLNFNRLDVLNKGLGAGDQGVDGQIDISFDLKSDENIIAFSYSGDIHFTESIEKESKAFKARNN